MKLRLFRGACIVAIAAGFGIAVPEANAALICVGSITTGSCSETDTINANQDFTVISIPIDYFTAPHPGDVLQSVLYSVGGSFGFAGTLTNSGSGTADGSFQVSKDNFSFAGGTPSSFLVPTVTNVGSAFGSSPVTLVPGQTSNFSISNAYNSATFMPSPAGYTGPGTFNALVNSSTSAGPVSSPSNFTASYTSSETAFVTVTYGYGTPSQTPVPEPASLTLLLSGLAGIALISRRKKRLLTDSLD